MGRLPPASSSLFLALIAALVVVGFLVVYWLRRDIEAESGPVTDADVLREFEAAYYSGEMDEAEFRRVTATLRARMSGAAAAPPPAPARPLPDPPEDGPAADPSLTSSV